VEEAADEYFIKGSVEETLVQHSDSTAQQQQQERGGNKDIKIRIPRKFKPVHMVLLKDLKDGAVTELRCHLCPETKLKS
jgi:hypothetical protein